MKKELGGLRVVVEWSPSQQAFHVQDVKGMIRDNLRVFHGKSINDYVCIGIFENREKLQAFLDEAYMIRDARLTEERANPMRCSQDETK